MKPVPIAAALVGKVEYHFAASPRKPVAADLGKYWGPERLIPRSVTGELTRDARNGFVEVNTPRTQALIGFLGRTRHALRDLTLKSPTKFGAVYELAARYRSSSAS